ncbi:hypothetical protein [Clostridium sp.]|uniref:hypothetical protein n=1 Tax=Clostridium sp. TaxID=1506 RepID=UPI001A46FEE2|nr:hypothetical protein [Clostridium sp.]MBK5239818.1 hypothetical protein [Clostridium sp.]
MAGIASDYGAFMELLMNDNDLKTLMLVPQNVFTNFAELRIKYFVEAFISDVEVVPDTCRLLIKNAPMNSTNNMMVKENNIIIEVFVPNEKDRLGNFERRTNQILDKLIKMFHRQLVNDRKFNLEASNELTSSVIGYKRSYVMFSYKRVFS